jgi:hypothetical protein
VNVLSAFGRYALWAFEFLVGPFRWISLVILVSLPVAAFASFRTTSSSVNRKNWYPPSLLLLAGFPLAIAIGVEFEAPLPGSPNHFGSLFLNSLSVLGLLLAIDCIDRAEGARLFTAALVVAG